MKALRMGIAALVFGSASLAFGQGVSVKLVKEYHVLERSRTLISHHGSILVGRTGTTSEGSNYIEEFNPQTLEMTEATPISHTIRRLQVMDECRVLVTGTDKYSIINYCLDYVRSTYSVGSDIVAHQIAYVGNEEIIAYEPNAGILKAEIGGKFKKIAEKISFTNSITTFGGYAWFSNYFNLYALNTETGEFKAVFENQNDYYGIKRSVGIELADGNEALAIVSRDAQKLLFLEIDSRELIHTLDLADADPEGIVNFGSCLAVSDSLNKKVLFIDYRGEAPKIIESWDASAAGDRLKQPSELAWDAATSQMFLRSSYPCLTCSVTQSSMFAVHAEDLSSLSTCLN